MGLNITYTLRCVSIIVGLIVLGVGAYSFHYSSWYNGNVLVSDDIFPSAKPGSYAACPDAVKLPGLFYGKTCPAIELEQFYIAMIVISFLMSAALLILGCLVELTTNPFKLIDFLSHVLCAVLLLIAAICYGVSAYLIRDLYPEGEIGDKTVEELKLLITWKYIATVFGLGQGVLLGILAFLVS